MEGDWDDDVVWSNAAYPLAALGAWGAPLAVFAVAVTGTLLAVGSGAYHAVYNSATRKLDTVSMMGYLVSVVGCLVSPSLGAPLAIAAYAFYWTVETDSQVHVPAWSALALCIVAIKSGWWALVPLALFAGAGTLQLTTDSDSWLHSLWHVAGAAAAGSALYLV
jgi:hypothetical protein